MTPFDYHSAKRGHSVCLRNGTPARIVDFQRKDAVFPLVVMVPDDRDFTEMALFYTPNGKCENGDSEYDLQMCGIKKQGWVNVYKTIGPYITSCVYNTEEEARKEATGSTIDTIQINWEESI